MVAEVAEPGRGSLAGLLKPRVEIPAPLEYPRIEPLEPLEPGEERPFWSVMIPTYNRTDYLEATLRSVLAQDPGPERMQIEVVDNASTRGDAEEIVRRVGGGRVTLYRQPETVPAYENWNSCVRRARGRWVHVLHDDDLALPGMYARYQALIEANPGATLVTGPCRVIDQAGAGDEVSAAMEPRDGPVADFAVRQATRNWLIPPSVVIAREAYERVGGFCGFVRHTIDWELFHRVGAAGKVLTTAEPFAAYRVHAASETDVLAHTGRHVRDAILTVDLCCGRLPEAERARLGPGRYRAVCELAKHFAWGLIRGRQLRGGMRNATLALRLSPADNAGFWVRSAAKCVLYGVMGAPGRPGPSRG